MVRYYKIRKNYSRVQPPCGPTFTGVHVSNLLLCYVIQMFFVTSVLHVHLMIWDDVNLVEAAVNKCLQVWETIHPEKVC